MNNQQLTEAVPRSIATNLLRQLRILLDLGAIYNLFIFVIGRFGFAKLLIASKYIPYTPGLRILDLGCGPGTNSTLFQPNDYIGIDISEEYIHKAKLDYPDYEFKCISFTDLPDEFDATFDLIMMAGLLHHLNDQQALSFMEKAHHLLKDGGHLITIDNCLHARQSRVKRNIIMMDRGKNVRSVRELVDLAAASDFDCSIHIEEDLLLIPYTHLMLTCRKQPLSARY